MEFSWVSSIRITLLLLLIAAITTACFTLPIEKCRVSTMEATAQIISYGHDQSVVSTLDHYEHLEKKPRLDHYDTDSRSDAEVKDKGKDEEEYKYDDDEDMSSEDSDYYGIGGENLSAQEVEKLKKEIKLKFQAWSATIKPEDHHALLDTTGACILEIDANKLILTNPSHLYRLVGMSLSCRRRMIIHTFTHPGERSTSLDGGGPSVSEASELSDLELQHYSTIAREVIHQYNEHSNSHLEFASFTRFAYDFPVYLYITFTARQNGNGPIGTYQAALTDDFFEEPVQLVLLRHVEADKILAILSISGAEEQLSKIYGENWNH